MTHTARGRVSPPQHLGYKPYEFVQWRSAAIPCGEKTLHHVGGNIYLLNYDAFGNSVHISTGKGACTPLTRSGPLPSVRHGEEQDTQDENTRIS